MKEILEKLNNLLSFKGAKIKPPIPSPMILMSKFRNGLSPLKITYAILAKKKQLGLPTGNFEDGTANYDDIMIKEIVTQVVKALQEDARITIAIPPGTQLVASGGNAGGPIVVYGTTSTITTGGGVIE
jgi:hypothetical protein